MPRPVWLKTTDQYGNFVTEFKEAEGEVGVKVLLSEEAREAAETEAGQIGEEEGEEKEEEVTPKDIGDIEAAIEHITLHEKEELEDVKEDIDEYKEVRNKISQLMRLCFFLSSVNSFFKRAGAAIQWG